MIDPPSHFSPRAAAIVFAAVLLTFIALGGRVVFLQTLGRERTILQADRQQHYTETLHARLRQVAAAHRRSVTQETIHLIETAMAREDIHPPATGTPEVSYWATRKLLPEYETALKAGAFSGGTDSTQIISEERDAR